MIVNIILFVVLLSIVFWYVERNYKILEIYNEPVEVSDARYENGIPVYFDIKYCKFDDITALVTQYLVHESDTGNHYEINIGSKISSYPKSKNVCSQLDPDSGRFAIYDSPVLVESGDYRIKVQVQYRPNPLRIVNVEFHSKVFSIQ